MPVKKKNQVKTNIKSKVTKSIKNDNPLLKNSINIKIDLEDDKKNKKLFWLHKFMISIGISSFQTEDNLNILDELLIVY